MSDELNLWSSDSANAGAHAMKAVSARTSGGQGLHHYSDRRGGGKVIAALYSEMMREKELKRRDAQTRIRKFRPGKDKQHFRY